MELSEPKTGSICFPDTLSEARLDNFRSVVRTHTLHNGVQIGLCQCKIFEAGESDIDYTDDAAGNRAPASSSNNAQHAEPVSAVKVAGLLNTATVQDVVDFLEWPVQAMQQMGSATPGGVQAPLLFAYSSGSNCWFSSSLLCSSSSTSRS